MKRAMMCWVGAITLGLMTLPGARAEDAVAVAPNVFTKVMENSRVRVLEATFAARTQVGLHEQGEHMFYVLTDGILVIKPPGRTPYEMTFKAGESFWLPAQTRSLENDSAKPIKALIVEVKGAGASSGAAASGRRGASGRRYGKSRRSRRR